MRVIFLPSSFLTLLRVDYMFLPQDAAPDIPFEVVGLTEKESKEINEEKNAEKRKELEKKYEIIYEGPRFVRRFESIPGQTGQLSLEQARRKHPQGMTPEQIQSSLSTQTPGQPGR